MSGNPSLDVCVFSARNIMQNGKEVAPPNTFCKIKIGNEIYGTNVTFGAFSPQWDTVASFKDISKAISKRENLKLTILTQKNKFVGQVKLPLQMLMADPKQDKWYPLMDKNNLRTPNITGEVHLSYQYSGPKVSQSAPVTPIAHTKAKKKDPSKRSSEDGIDFIKLQKEAEEQDRKELLGAAAANRPEEVSDNDFVANYNPNDTESIIQETARLRLAAKKSVQRSAARLEQTTCTAIQTQAKLEQQGRQLRSVSADLDTMDAQLDLGKRYIRGIRSMFGNVGRRRNKKREEEAFGMPRAYMHEEQEAASKAKEMRQKIALEASQPARVITRSDSADSLDDELEKISARVLNLKDMALNMGNEIEAQSESIEKIDGKLERNYAKVQQERAAVARCK